MRQNAKSGGSVPSPASSGRPAAARARLTWANTAARAAASGPVVGARAGRMGEGRIWVHACRQARAKVPAVNLLW